MALLRTSVRSIAVTLCEWTARLCLLTVTALLPWSFGGVDPFSQSLMFVFLLTAQFCGLILQGLRPQTPTPTPWLALPITAALLGGLVQTADVGEAAVQVLSPSAHELRRELLPSGDPTDALPRSTPSLTPDPPPWTLSLYAPATRKELSLLLCGLSVLLVSGTLFQSPRSLVLLAFVLAANGAAVAYFGILQQLSWNGLLYWSVPIEGSTPFGPFVNRNAAGGYLVLCLAATIPLLARGLGREHWQQSSIDAPPDFGWWTPRPEAAGFAIVILLALLLGGLMASLSRGAWLGAVVGTAAAMAVVGRAHFRRGLLIAAFGGLAIAGGVLAWLSLTAPLGERLASVADAQQALQSRWSLWQDSLRMVPEYWRVGSGLGTYGFIQPLYQSQPMLVWFDQAENLYLQALVESGIVGCVLLLAAVVLALVSIRPLSRADAGYADTAFAGMAAFVVCSQAVCAAFDFSLRYPANQFALALVVGATIGRAMHVRSLPTSARAGGSWARRGAAIVVHALLLLAMTKAWSELSWAGGVDLVLNRGQSEFEESSLTVDEIDEELSSLDLLLSRRPDDAEGHLRIAALYVVRFRQQALQQMRDELGPDADVAELWPFTSPMVLHRRAAEFARDGDAEALAELRSDATVHDNLEPAVRHALLARAYGPLLCRAHQLLGQLCFLDDEPQLDALHIEHAARLLPQDPAVRYWAGALHLQSGRPESAREHWRRCLVLSLEYDDRILPVALERMSLAVFVDELLPDSPEVLLRVADRGQLANRPPELDRLLGAKLLRALEASAGHSVDPAEIDYWTARGRQLVGDLEPALEPLKRATARNPGNIQWRMRLAMLLRDLGQTREAVREAEVCVRLDPDNADAQHLLDEVSAAELNRARAAQEPHGEAATQEPRTE